jgi:fatty acid desaturase
VIDARTFALREELATISLAVRDEGSGDDFKEAGDDRLPRALLKDLCRIDPIRSTAWVLLTWAEIAVLVAASIAWWNGWIVPVSMLLLATRAQALFVIAHDAAHYRLYETRWLNDLIGSVCATPVGFSMTAYRIVHRLHHNHLYGADDPDTPIHGGYPRGRAYLARKLLKDLFGLSAWKTYAYFFGAPSAKRLGSKKADPLGDTSRELRNRALRDRWVVLGFHLTALAAACAFGVIIEYALLWLVPLVFLLQPILRFRSILEHGMTSERGDVWRDARTNLGPRWLLWALFPRNVNFHLEHHLYPGVPHYNLAEVHAALKDRGLLDRAEVRRVFATMRMAFAPRPGSHRD